MKKQIKLSDILEQMEFVNDQTVAYLDRRTGKFHLVNEDIGLEFDRSTPLEEAPEWMREDLAVAQAIERGDDEHLVALPTQFDIHEYEIMEKFCESYSDRRVSQRLCDAIHGRGAFRRFKDMIHGTEISDEWYRFRDRAYGEVAIEWCEENDIPYENDVPSQSEPVRQSDTLESRVQALLTGQRDAIANAANLAAEVFCSVDRINWCGFYFLKEGELVLGPFQGRPACTTIALDRGVCGAAATRRETLVVPDVHQFPGHIACDAASRSEIVVPILHDECLVGVFDVDSPDVDRFGDGDRRLFERLVEIYVAHSDLGQMGRHS